MVKEFIKIANLIKCKFTDNTKGVVSLFSIANKMVNELSATLRKMGKMLDIYALTARNVNGGGGLQIQL